MKTTTEEIVEIVSKHARPGATPMDNSRIVFIGASNCSDHYSNVYIIVANTIYI